METVQSYRCGEDIIIRFVDVDDFSHSSAGASNPNVNFGWDLEFSLEDTDYYNENMVVSQEDLDKWIVELKLKSGGNNYATCAGVYKEYTEEFNGAKVFSNE